MEIPSTTFDRKMQESDEEKDNPTCDEGVLSITEAARSAAIEDGVPVPFATDRLVISDGRDDTASHPVFPQVTVSGGSFAVDDICKTTGAGNALGEENDRFQTALKVKKNSADKNRTKSSIVQLVHGSIQQASAHPVSSSTSPNTVSLPTNLNAKPRGQSLNTHGPPSLVNKALSPSVPASLTSSRDVSTSTGSSAVGAMVSGSGSGSSGGRKKGHPLRRGKWTLEEEAYANRLIQEFKAGLLPLTDGTTLRTFLSKLLNCDPMRISKKFVGNNCIGKQVFRRRTADMSRLTPEQIKHNRYELGELERRFLDRVAQTTKAKTPGVGSTNVAPTIVGSAPSGVGTQLVSTSGRPLVQDAGGDPIHRPPTPPWLRPPIGYKPGMGASLAAAALSSGSSNRAAVVGRALLQGSMDLPSRSMSNNTLSLPLPLPTDGAENIHNISNLPKTVPSQNSLRELLQVTSNSSLPSSNSFAQFLANRNNSLGDGLSSSILSQLVRNDSSLPVVSAGGGSGSLGHGFMVDAMLRSAISRDQLSQLVREQELRSSPSMSNVFERKSSLDALMSLDFQSLQSMDNLVSIVHNQGGDPVPKSGAKNWSGETNNNAARLGNLISSLSSGNIGNKMNLSGTNSSMNFTNFLQSIHSNLNGVGNSTNNLYGPAASALNLANMFRVDSSTGLTAMRMQEGLAQRNSSIDDFLSLMASGDIPHQDPHLLNIPLQTHFNLLQQQQQQQHNSNQQSLAAAAYLAQQQMLAPNPRVSSMGLTTVSNNHNNMSYLSTAPHQQNGNVLNSFIPNMNPTSMANARGQENLLSVSDQLSSFRKRKLPDH